MYEHFAGLSEKKLLELMKDPYWRIRNLYYVLDKNKQTVLFIPNEAQEALLNSIWYRNIIPKARQRGFSTLIQIILLDACLFVENTIAAVIAQDLVTAGKIMRQKIKFAYRRLPKFLRDEVPITVNNVTEVQFSNGSSISVSTSARGDTLSYLHVSEYGAICASSPETADEIETGALPAAERGITFIESTAKGREGNYFKMVQKAKAVAESGRKLKREEFKLHFASWWDAAEYETDPNDVVITKEDHAYFERVEAQIRRPLPIEKRAWYVSTRENTFSGSNEKMWQEYPSFLDEAFQVSTEGVYLREQLTKARLDNRIGRIPHRPGQVVNTVWDLGVGDDIAIWFFQDNGPFVDWINYLEGSGEPYDWFIRQMDAMGYVWGRDYLPHDANQRKPGSYAIQTPVDMLRDLGRKNIIVVPQTPHKMTAIQQLRNAFSTYRFDETNCDPGIKHLENYKKRWNQANGCWSDEPHKNGHQHAADAIMQHAQSIDSVDPTQKKTPKRRNRSGLAA